MDFKKIMINLIEFCTLIDNTINDINCGEYIDEEKSDDWNDGAENAIKEVKIWLENYGIFFDEGDDDLVEEIKRLDILNED